jgi:hypothetical protein
MPTPARSQNDLKISADAIYEKYVRGQIQDIRSEMITNEDYRALYGQNSSEDLCIINPHNTDQETERLRHVPGMKNVDMQYIFAHEKEYRIHHVVPINHEQKKRETFEDESRRNNKCTLYELMFNIKDNYGNIMEKRNYMSISGINYYLNDISSYMNITYTHPYLYNMLTCPNNQISRRAGRVTYIAYNRPHDVSKVEEYYYSQNRLGIVVVYVNGTHHWSWPILKSIYLYDTQGGLMHAAEFEVHSTIPSATYTASQ